MSLTVETGTGTAGADTYVTLADYQSYATKRGWTLVDDETDEINLRRAFDGINRSWGYRGERVSDSQAGAWPRTIYDGIPTDVIIAQIELAYLIQGGLDLFATIEGGTTSESIKVGPITISEGGLPSGKARVVAVEGLLRPYLSAGAGQTALVRG